MTNSEIIDLLSQGLADESQERFETKIKIITALDEQERYAWHNLDKDPKDMPRSSEEVLVWIVHQNKDNWKQLDIAWNMGGIWFCRNISSLELKRYYRIIAWKKIEKFGVIE